MMSLKIEIMETVFPPASCCRVLATCFVSFVFFARGVRGVGVEGGLGLKNDGLIRPTKNLGEGRAISVAILDKLPRQQAHHRTRSYCQKT